METFSVLLDLYEGNSPVPGEFPSQGPLTRSFDVFFDLRLIKRLSKNHRDAGSHYDVTVMALTIQYADSVIRSCLLVK